MWEMTDGSEELFYGTVKHKSKDRYKVVFDDGDVQWYNERAILDGIKRYKEVVGEVLSQPDATAGIHVHPSIH